jgi:hypothetical protein
VKGHDFSRVIKHYRMARASAPVAFLLLKWKSFESRREKLGSLTGHNFKTTRATQPPKPGDGQVHPTARSFTFHRPSVHTIPLSIYSKVPLSSHFGHDVNSLRKLNSLEETQPQSFPKKTNTPKTQRRPGSPHSKKLHLPPPARPYDSALDLRESTPLVPFRPRLEQLAQNSTASKRHGLSR